jgi:hypothetical protein
MSHQGLLIDPEKHTVEPVTVRDIRDVAQLLGASALQTMLLTDTDHLVVDQKGLRQNQIGFFRFTRFPGVVIGGKALVLGHTDGGKEQADVSVDAEELFEDHGLEFLNVAFDRMELVDGGMVETPIGWGQSVIYVPIFHEKPMLPPEVIPPEAAPDVKAWTVTWDEKEKLYKAMLLKIRPGQHAELLHELENEDLDTLRDMLPASWRVVPRDPGDHPSLVETWMQP